MERGNLTARSGASLPVEHATVKRSDLEPEILPRLKGSVFHVTSERAFVEIETAAAILSNRDRRFRFTFPQSENSYGRQRGFVCLFDLRDISDDTIRDVLTKFHFLKPTSADPVFLFLDQSEYGNLVPWTEAPIGVMLIPYVEAWYPRDLPVGALSHALAVTVEKDDVDSAYRGIMRRLERDKEDLLDSGLVGIEARTVDELKQRTEEWVRVAREAGLEVDLGWDEGRIARTAGGFRISLQAVRAEYWAGLAGGPA